MSELVSARLPHPDSGPSDFGSSSVPARGRTHGLSVIFWLLEQRRTTLLALWLAAASPVALVAQGRWWVWLAALAAVPTVGVLLPLLYLVYRSHQHDGGHADWEPFLTWRDDAKARRWRGKKIPIAIAYEAYVAEELDLKQDISEVLRHRNQLFRFCFTWSDVSFYFRQFLRQNLSHTPRSDRSDIVPVYDRGNDFYGWFLGETMVYTSGVFRDVQEPLEVAQRRKLELICDYVQMQPGDRHLDIGCGWGSLLVHAAAERGAVSTGITLAKEQAEFARARAEERGVLDRVQVLVDDYRNLPPAKFDKITCVEMAEHVGIKNFQRFLLQVRDLLKDDGVFYLQIAGLRRSWQFEDLVWGLFMAKYVFPGADASCPLGFVVDQAERAGFEVHRVENCGSHYALTIEKWLDNWKSNEAAIVAKYGRRWFRLWCMFLGWSANIGYQGSSAVFFITLNKNAKNDQQSVSAEERPHVALHRRARWVGPAPVATQQ